MKAASASLLSYAILMSGFVHAGESANPCTQTQIARSNAFYFPNGQPKSNRFVAEPPKFCRTGAPANRYPCAKPGAQAAIDLFHRDYDQIMAAAKRADETYEIPDPVAKLARQSQGSFKTLVRWPYGGKRGEVVENIRLPIAGATERYIDPHSGLVFSLTREYGPESPSYIIAFKGTTKSDTRDWQYDAVQDGRLHELHVAGVTLFKALGLEANEYLHIPPIYMRAILVGQDFQALLRDQGDPCKSRAVYTGHSLGGGLALFASLMSTSRCNVKGDSVILFNAAMPGEETMNPQMLSSASNNVNLIVDVNLEGEVIQGAQPIKVPFLTTMSSKSQVVRFSNIDINDLPIHRPREKPKSLVGIVKDAIMKPINKHPMAEVLLPLQAWGAQQSAMWPARLQHKHYRPLCAWYEPLIQADHTRQKIEKRSNGYKRLGGTN